MTRFISRNNVSYIFAIAIIFMIFVQFIRFYQITYTYPDQSHTVNRNILNNRLNQNKSMEYESEFKIISTEMPSTTIIQENLTTKKTIQIPNITSDSNVTCRGNIFLYTIIISEKKNEKQRQKIRQSWASLKIINQKLLSSVFLVVANNNENNLIIDDLLEEESKQYQDIFYSKSLKIERQLLHLYLDALKLGNQCKSANFHMVITEDMFPNIPLIIDQLSTNVSLMCNLNINNPVIRNKQSIYYVAKSDYTNDRYPPHCRANSPIIISSDLVKQIVENFHKSNLWFYDVYLFGIVPETLNATLIQFPKSMLLIEMRPHFVYVNKKQYGFLTNGNLLPNKIWKKLMLQMILK